RVERPADVRLLIGTTNPGTADSVTELAALLQAVVLEVPALREREGDIRLLTEHFVERSAAKLAKPVPRLTPEFMRLVERYPWPGNVGELRSVIDQAVLLADGKELLAQLLPDRIHHNCLRDETIRIKVGTNMGSIEREVILRTLAANKGNKTLTA